MPASTKCKILTTTYCKLMAPIPKYIHENNKFYIPRQILIKIIILLCGNKMPTRCNRGFYCISYCLLNMFRTPLCPLSGAQEYYTAVAACGISCYGFQVAGLVWS